jgi:hypothetical protein
MFAAALLQILVSFTRSRCATPRESLLVLLVDRLDFAHLTIPPLLLLLILARTRLRSLTDHLTHSHTRARTDVSGNTMVLPPSHPEGWLFCFECVNTFMGLGQGRRFMETLTMCPNQENHETHFAYATTPKQVCIARGRTHTHTHTHTHTNTHTHTHTHTIFSLSLCGLSYTARSTCAD